jgi:formate-dependent nitrite reductase membrane component NrfD
MLTPSGAVQPDRYHELVATRAATPFAVQPQGAWGLEIAGYLYLGGLGAGAFAMAVIFDWLGFGLAPRLGEFLWEAPWDWTKLLFLWGPVITGVGASLLILHLGKNRSRFFTAGANPRTSWMARGFAILLTFILSACALALVALLAPEAREANLGVWRAFESVAVLAALGTAAYTGVLLRSMSFIPAWSTRWLPLLFLASALSTGSMGNLVLVSVLEALGGKPPDARFLEALLVVEPVVILLEGAVLVALILRLRRGNPAAFTSADMLLHGRWRFPFWAGVVGAALVVPFALDLVDLFVGSKPVALLGAVSVLLGGFILRLAVLGVGVKEVPPLYRLGLWRDTHPQAELKSAAEVSTRLAC